MPSEEQDEQTGAGAPITRAKVLRQGLAVAGSVAIAPHLLRSDLHPLAQGSRRVVAPKGQVIDAFTQEAVNFNPLLYVNTGVETAVEYSVFDAPWKIDTTGRFIPNLATEIPSVANGGITEHGRVWTLRFRRDVTWHDGAPFTSKDVRFAFETIMNPKVVVRSTAGTLASSRPGALVPAARSSCAEGNRSPISESRRARSLGQSSRNPS